MFVMDNKLELTERQKGLLLDGKPKYIRNYLKLPYLLNILEEKKLYLSDSLYFKDYMDKQWTDDYKKRTNSDNLYALCCTWETELYHHWNCYSGDNFGCCLVFDGQKLIEQADKKIFNHGFIHYKKNIPYRNIPDGIPDEEIPFTKAWAYRCECEYRFVSTSEKHFSIDLETIKQVSITAKMDTESYEFFKNKIIKIHDIKVTHSRLEKDND